LLVRSTNVPDSCRSSEYVWITGVPRIGTYSISDALAPVAIEQAATKTNNEPRPSRRERIMECTSGG